RGAGVESCVGICLDRSASYVVAVLAALKAGACWLPLDPRLPCEPPALLVDGAPPAGVLSGSLFSRRHEERWSPTPAGVHAAEAGASAPSVVPEGDARRAHATPPVVLRLDSLAKELALQADQAPSATVAPANLAYIIYTSGSTGRPKGVMVPHRAIGSRLRWG